MKPLITAITVALLSASPAFAADLFRQNFKMDGEGDFEARVVETFKLAIESKTPNAVQDAVKALKADVDDMGTVHDVTVHNLFEIYQGRGSASEFGRRYIVGIPVTMKGTGMIEQYSLMYVAYYAGNMAKEEESVVIERQLDIDPEP